MDSIVDGWATLRFGFKWGAVVGAVFGVWGMFILPMTWTEWLVFAAQTVAGMGIAGATGAMAVQGCIVGLLYLGMNAAP